MENATKALEMAGSVLIGILILGCLVFTYTKISETKKDEQVSERVKQASDFNKDYVVFDRDNLYGSDMFSVANQIDNYNIKESDTKYYGKIEIKVNVSTQIRGARFFTKTNYNVESLNKAYKDLTNAIKDINTEYFGKKVSYWSNYGTSSRLESQLLQELGQNKYNTISEAKKNELKNAITDYKDYLGEQKDMARKTFKCIKIEYYDDTGRVKYMEFSET